jgi:DNA gyrase subunit A
MIVVPHGDTAQTCMVLTACENGFGKRTPVDEYRLIRRGGKGVINIKTTERNGNVVGMKAVCDTDELMLITEGGILMRTRVSEIRETGRNAAGVRLIKLDEGDKLVAMAKIDAEPDKPAGDGAAPVTTEGDLPPSAVSGDGSVTPADADASSGEDEAGADPGADPSAPV